MEETIPDDATLSADFEWMIRPCQIYHEEYKECTNYKARFHQYFIYGDLLDCNQWKKNFDNCDRWKKTKNEAAKVEIIVDEMKRKNARLKAHYNNNIWKIRNEPPKDWNKPLPEWLAKRDENTYLAEKAKEMRGEQSKLIIDPENWSCSIM